MMAPVDRGKAKQKGPVSDVLTGPYVAPQSRLFTTFCRVKYLYPEEVRKEG